jgi:hypothetical protein
MLQGRSRFASYLAPHTQIRGKILVTCSICNVCTVCMLVPSPQEKSQQMKNVFTKTWRNDGELAGEKLLKGTALLPRQRFVAVSYRTVYTLSHVQYLYSLYSVEAIRRTMNCTQV